MKLHGGSYGRFALTLVLLIVALGIAVARGNSGDAVIIAVLLGVGLAVLAALLYLPRHLSRRSQRSEE